MPPEPQTVSSKIEWNKVTWYSKLGAIILFLGIVPALCFYIGMQYELAQQSLILPMQTSPAVPTPVQPAPLWVSFTTVASTTAVNSLYYAEKDNQVYVQAIGTTQSEGTEMLIKIISGADPNSFIIMPDLPDMAVSFAKDKDKVYYIQIGGDAVGGGIEVQTITGADPATFKVIEFGTHLYDLYATDKNQVYGCDPQNQDGCTVAPIMNADPSTFVAVKGNGYDAQDKSHKYYLGKVVQ